MHALIWVVPRAVKLSSHGWDGSFLIFDFEFAIYDLEPNRKSEIGAKGPLGVNRKWLEER